MSKVIMSFEADSFEELTAKIIKAAKSMGHDPNQFELPLAEAPKKAPKPAPLPPEPSEVPEELPAAATLSKEEFNAAFSKLYAEKGHVKTKAVLAKLGFERISQVKSEKFNEIISELEKVA